MGGEVEKIVCVRDEENGISYGQFPVRISIEEIEYFTQCKKYLATSEPNRTKNKVDEIDLLCVVIKQPNDILQISELFEVKGQDDPVVMGNKLVDVTSYLPVLMFCEKVEEEFLPIEITIDEDNSDLTHFILINEDRRDDEDEDESEYDKGGNEPLKFSEN